LTTLLSTAGQAGALARAIAGARDVQQLAARLAQVLATADENPGVRIWRVRIGEVAEVASSAGLRDAPTAHHAVLRATAKTDPTRYGDAWLVPVLHLSVPVGVIELHQCDLDAAAVVATASEALGGQLETLWGGRSGAEVAAMLRTSSMASQIQSVILTFSAQVQTLLPHDRLSIYLLTPDGSALERFAVACSPPVAGEMDIRPLAAVGLSRVTRTNTPIVSDDFGRDARILGDEDELIARAGFHAIVSVPLRLVGAAFGLLNFVSRERGFYTEEHVAPAQQIADQIAVFLYELRVQRAAQAELEMNAIQRERDRVAKELHDTLAQSLARLTLRAQSLERQLEEPGARATAAELTDIAQRALEDVRHSLFSTIPAELVDHTLVQALEGAAESFGRDTGIAPCLDIVGNADAISREVQGVVLRIAQECLTNVAKHAHASSVSVSLHIGRDTLSLSINDDGRGFRGEAAAGFGLRAMRSRALEIGGELVVVTSEGGPTEIHLLTPTATGLDSRPTDSSENGGAGARGARAVRVLVVDDHPLFVHALTDLLGRERDIQVVGTACTGADAVALAGLAHPDVLLLDLELPDTGGAKVVKEVRALEDPPVVLMLSAFGQAEHISAAMKAGAHGYLPKTADGRVLVDAVRAAVRGTMLFGATPWQDLVEAGSRLTSRELELLHHLASGMTNRDIAAVMHVAPKTVERIVATVVTKLRARNRTHAVALALSRELVDPHSVQAPC
jgi:signal transduction histidine kinase/DNA-binding NarL/FixJ family response regulator